MNKGKTSPHTIPNIAITIIFLVVSVAWWKWPSIVSSMEWNGGNRITTSVISTGLEQQGQMGDMFGSFNAFFAAFSVMGVVYTLLLQRGDLSRTRKEVENAKIEADEHRKKENEKAELQRFETTFFQLLQTFNSIVGSFEKHNVLKGHREVTITGREVIAHDIEEFRSFLSEANKEAGQDSVDFTTARYNEFYYWHEVKLAHYFRMLYRITKWLDRAPKDRSFYAKTLRAQLSSQEVLLLMFNCLHEFGAKMKPLAEQYGLLKHLSVDKEEFADEIAQFEPGAFGDPQD